MVASGRAGTNRKSRSADYRKLRGFQDGLEFQEGSDGCRLLEEPVQAGKVIDALDGLGDRPRHVGKTDLEDFNDVLASFLRNNSSISALVWRR